MLISILVTLLALLAFCLACKPDVWLRLWDPLRRQNIHAAPRTHSRGALLGVRIRSLLAGVILLILGIVLPVIASDVSRGPVLVRTDTRPALAEPFEIQTLPRSSFLPESTEPRLSLRLRQSAMEEGSDLDLPFARN